MKRKIFNNREKGTEKNRFPFFVLLLMAAFAFAGCNKDDDNNELPPEEQEAITLTAMPASISAPAAGDAYPFSLACNTMWTAAVSTSATWCMMQPSSGNGDSAGTITVAVNPTEDSRAATITFTSGEVTRKITVAQEAAFTSYEAADAPPQAASNKVWVFGDQIWSDRIVAMPSNCTQTISLDLLSYTIAEYRVYEGRNYYSWSCMNAAQATLCPSPWRVPSQQDGNTLISNTNCSTLIYAWDYGGQANGSFMVNVNSQAYYWSTTLFDGGMTYAYSLAYDSRFLVMSGNHKGIGFQVRCVK
jgi:hypothetical protein